MIWRKWKKKVKLFLNLILDRERRRKLQIISEAKEEEEDDNFGLDEEDTRLKKELLKMKYFEDEENLPKSAGLEEGQDVNAKFVDDQQEVEKNFDKDLNLKSAKAKGSKKNNAKNKEGKSKKSKGKKRKKKRKDTENVRLSKN